MATIEVSCPSCGAKLKADANMSGRKAKCKKCGTTFRLPGQKVSAPVADSLGDPPLALSVEGDVLTAAPVDDIPLAAAADEVPMAAPVAPEPAPKPAPPAPKVEKPPEKATEKVKEKLAEKPVEKPVPKPAAKVPEKPADKPAEKPTPKALEKPTPKPVEKPAAKPAPKSDRPKTKAAEPVAFVPPEPDDEETVADDGGDNPFAFGGAAAETKADKVAPSDEKKLKAEKGAADPGSGDGPAPKRKRGVANSPFALGNLLDGPPSPPEPPAKNGAKGDKGATEPEADDGKPRYRRPGERASGTTKSLFLTVVVGAVAVALGVAAVMVYVRDRRADAEALRKSQEPPEKKEEDPFAGNPPAPPAVPPAPEAPPAPGPDPKPQDKQNPEPKAKDKAEPKAKEPAKPKEVDPVSGKPLLALAKLRPVTAGAVGAKVSVCDPPKDGLELDTPFAGLRRVFPRAKPTDDLFVLVQLAPPNAEGRGEKLALDTYTGSKVRDAKARVEFPGDATVQPIADLIVTPSGPRFLAGVAGKVHVWPPGGSGKPVVYEPYADKPEHARAGLAAAFFNPDGTHLVTVSTAGAVLVYDTAARKPVGEFVPPHGAPGKVALGTSVAKADGNGSVAVAVAGVVYQIKAGPKAEVLRTLDLGGDVGRSLGVAASGTPGRLLYAFETAAGGKKERAVAVLPLDDKGKGTQLFGFPTGAAGTEARGALWAGGDTAVVVADRGAVLFDDEGGTVRPLAALVPNGPGALFAGTPAHVWFALPHPKQPAKSVLVALSADLNDREEFTKAFPAGKPLPALRIDDRGASR